MPWSAVAMGLGVWLWFGLAQEPGPIAYGAVLATGAGAAALGRWRREVLGPVSTAALCVALGFLAAGFRAHQVAAPGLEFRYYGPIEGRIAVIDRSASDAVRLTLDQVVLARMAPARTPTRVRVSLHGDQDWITPRPGDRVILTGHLSPPNGPAEPGGFDFQRHAWFLGLGAVGYTRTPALLLAPRAQGDRWLAHFRMRLSADIQARIDGDAGAFAAAVMTGDRSGLRAEPVAAMRAANIAHLLAISGLHMGLLVGFVFGALRYGLALIPALALRVPIRKWAAGGALIAAAGYLALSGGNVATERAFIQVAVMLVAVMLDRRAITLRSVALAALIVLAHRPETLLGPGFQMSFAATAALVAVFNGLRAAAWLSARPAWARWALALILSSLVAGAATAPFSAYHFNQISYYGLLANVISVPLMGIVVIPMAVLAALLAPIGLADAPLSVAALALRLILSVADGVASLPGATGAIAQPAALALPILVLGALIWILWRGPGRWLGAAPVVVALALWPRGERPDILIQSAGLLVGVMTEEGRALSRPRGAGFVAGIWLENDGDRADQEAAAGREPWQPEGLGRGAQIAGLSIWHATGQRAADQAAEACAAYDLLVLSAEPETWPAQAVAPLLGQPVWGAAQAGTNAAGGATWPASGMCLLITPAVLAESGALAIHVGDGHDDLGGLNAIHLITARHLQGNRLWTTGRGRE